jgi:hypothetical protein
MIKLDLDLGLSKTTNNDIDAPSPAELTDEIKEFRRKNKEFSATSDHETYIVLCFSCKEDKETFCEETGIVEHTLVDGYEFAKSIGKKPQKPGFKLHKPLHLLRSKATKTDR